MKKIYVFIFLILGSVGVWGQQVIGSFPTMDGGFESQVAGNLTGTTILPGAQRTDWTVQSTTGSRLITTTGGRSGPKYVTYGTTTATGRRLQSPTAADAAVVNLTAYTIQYFYKTAGATGASNGQAGASPDGTSFPGTYVATTLAGTSGVWTKSTTAVTSGTSAANPKYGVGVIRFGNISGVDIDIDDFVMYAGAVDNAAPNSAGTVTVNNPTGTTLDVSWLAASGGVDGGGYVVVRYAVLPGATDDPLQNGIYATGNSVPGGISGTVVYIGTGLGFTDVGLAGSTTYYYKVYTVDKAFNYAVESEGNGTTTSAIPDIVLSSPNPAVPAGNLPQGTNNNVIYRFDLAVTTADAILTGLTISTSFTYLTGDFTNFKCWYSSDAVFNPGTDVLLATHFPLMPGTQTFPPLTSQTITSGTTGYYFITVDLPCTAALGNTITVNPLTTADISFVSGNKSGTAFAGGLQTITAATVFDVTGAAASIGNTLSSVSWISPTGCYDEVMIVAAAGATNSGTPTGDGTAYTAALSYGAGTALGNGFVVYKGPSSSPQVVNTLVNGTTYYFKIYTRFGTTWSSGVEVNATPDFITNPTDYFRSVANGSWATLATWQSSVDSVSWIAATVVPGATAAHVVIQNPDSVWLDANRTTANLTIMSGAIMNALTFTMTATLRFNLLGTATYYQGGTVTTVPGLLGNQVLATTSNYRYNGTQAGTSAALPEYGNLFWEPTASGAGTFVNNNASAPFNNGLVVRGNMTINIQGGTVREIRFATGSSISRIHTIDGNLNIISAVSTVVVQNGSNAVTSIVNIGGDINISAGILQGTSTTAATTGSGILNLRGNINNTGGTIQTGNSTAGLFSLNYVGIVPQNINSTGGTYTFTANQRDSINNAGNGVTLNTPITHNGTINFLSGNINTTNVNLLILGATATVLNASNASFVNGPVSKIGNTLFTFPVGKTDCGPGNTVSGYAPIAISAPATATDQFTAEYVHSSGHALGTITALGLEKVSACDYWNLNQVSGANTLNVTLNWNAAVNNCTTASAYVDDLPALVVAHFDGLNWDAFGAPGTATGTPAAGDVTWPNVSTFSPFAIGSISFNNPLPITINYFNGTRSNGNHLLNWKVTCVSTPSATIEMERSTDGRNYNSIYSIFATAVRCEQPFTHTDNQPAKGINYYRIKMTGADGKITYSTVVTLINAVKGIDVMNIAPNPIVNGRFNLKISTAEKTQMELVITDMQGRVLQKQSASMIAGFNQLPVNVRNLAAGTYQLFGNTTDGRTRVLRFVIQ